MLDVFKFRDAQKEAMNLARIGNKYLADTEPWKLAKTDMPRVATILNISLQLVANLAIRTFPSVQQRKTPQDAEYGQLRLGRTRTYRPASCRTPIGYTRTIVREN